MLPPWLAAQGLTQADGRGMSVLAPNAISPLYQMHVLPAGEARKAQHGHGTRTVATHTQRTGAAGRASPRGGGSGSRRPTRAGGRAGCMGAVAPDAFAGCRGACSGNRSKGTHSCADAGNTQGSAFARFCAGGSEATSERSGNSSSGSGGSSSAGRRACKVAGHSAEL